MKLCFILACKVYKSHETYIDFYVNNIRDFYPAADIILVDNNSSYSEYFDQFRGKSNITLLENTSEQKFSLGAYNFAAKYIENNSLEYDYCICSQDTFVLVNKYDFQLLKNNNIEACPFGHILSVEGTPEHYDILKQLGLYIPNDTYKGAWCTSWICTTNVLKKIYDYTYSIKITTCWESQVCERYMGKILTYLNNNVSISIEGSNSYVDTIYIVNKVNVKDPETKKKCVAFVKSSQGKKETTV
jgi:hypothetical protein